MFRPLKKLFLCVSSLASKISEYTPVQLSCDGFAVFTYPHTHTRPGGEGVNRKISQGEGGGVEVKLLALVLSQEKKNKDNLVIAFL